MNCWIWIILLWCCGGGNGCCRNNCMCNNGCVREPSPCETFPPQPNPGCGCGNEMIQPRAFAGFGDNATCGCEEKESCQN